MASISRMNNDSVSALFSGLNNSAMGGNSIYGIDYSTLNTIKNGSYSKLLKSYYSKDGGHAAEVANKTNSKDLSTDSSATQKVNATSNRDNASSVIDASKSLKATSLWSKKSTTDSEGKTTSDYDRDAIYKAANSFVEGYNSLVKSTGDSEDKSTLNTASNMVNYTRANAKLLKDIGISVGSDNKLTIDKDTFKKADMTTVKSVFTGSGSFGQSVSASASSVYSSAVSQLSKLATQNTYSSSGSYSYVSGSSFSSFT